MTAMSPCCAELEGSRRTTIAITKGSPRRDRSAASWSSSARISGSLRVVGGAGLAGDGRSPQGGAFDGGAGLAGDGRSPQGGALEADAVQVFGHVEIGEPLRRPGQLLRLTAVAPDHALSASLVVERAQLGEELARIEDGWRQH